MDVDKAGLGLDEQRNVRRAGLLAASLLGLAWTPSALAEPRHFDLPAGDAQVMVNEFSRQADLQVLFDYPKLAGMQTHAVVGEFEPPDALTVLLQNLPLHVSWVNDRTLAIKPVGKNLISQGIDRLRKLWHKATASPEHPETPEILEQVLIAARLDTTHDPPPIGASLIRLSRTDIENSGYATTQDFIHTLPQVFGGGPSEDTQLGREALSNASQGSGINLRGLDASATLVLIDGHRVAPSGGLALYADISNIPLSAIDHVDIVPDGASAQFGADAIGGVANFVLRSDFSGSETQLRYGGITGGPIGQRQGSQLWGTSWDGGRGMLGFEYYNRDAIPATDRFQATSDLRKFGGNNFNQQYGSGPGTLTVGPQTYAIPNPSNGAPLTAADLIPGTQNLYDQWTGADLLASQKRWSVFGTLRTDAHENVSIFADSLLTHRTIADIYRALPLAGPIPTSNPFYLNPTGGRSPVLFTSGAEAYLGSPTTHGDVDTGNLSLGATTLFGRTWSVTGYVGYSFEKYHFSESGLVNLTAFSAALADSDPEAAFNPFVGRSAENPATLAAIGWTAFGVYNSNVRMTGLTASGGLFALPGGDAHLTLGAELRNQTFDQSNFYVSQDEVQSPTDSLLHRNIRAIFAQIQLPLVRQDAGIPLLHRLDLSIGERYEDYSDVGKANTPKVGLLWSPFSSVSLRGTWTRAFRPPALPDLVSANSFSQVNRLPDPNSPTHFSTALLAYGTNSTLENERARTWTLGAEIAPPAVRDLSVAVTYFHTDYDNRIDTVNLAPTLFSDPTLAWLVNRNITATVRGDVCGQTRFVGSGSCLDTPIDAIVDNRIRNVEYLHTQGIDLLGKYKFASGFGRFEAGFNGTYLLAYTEQRTPGLPPIALLSTPNNPINLRIRSSLSWDHRGWGASFGLNFDNAYKDTLSQPNRHVRSWTTFDAQLRYQSEGGDWGPFSNLEFAISAQNVFNRSPPFLNNPVGVGYDQENADLIGRIVSLDIRKHWY
jgi:iron complex outermembrane recepter protein